MATVPNKLASSIGQGSLGGVQWLIIISFLATLVFGLILAYTRFGRYTYAIGSNPEAARRVGINVDWYLMLIYGLSGLMAGLAGIMNLSYYSTTTISGHPLDNLTVIVDRNHYQQTGASEDVLDLDPIDGKFASCGWQTFALQGNDMEMVVKILEHARAFKGQPTCVLSLTRKGQGILKLPAKLGDENFHGKPVPKKHLDEALAEIG